MPYRSYPCDIMWKNLSSHCTYSKFKHPSGALELWAIIRSESNWDSLFIESKAGKLTRTLCSVSSKHLLLASCQNSFSPSCLSHPLCVCSFNVARKHHPMCFLDFICMPDSSCDFLSSTFVLFCAQSQTSSEVADVIQASRGRKEARFSSIICLKTSLSYVFAQIRITIRIANHLFFCNHFHISLDFRSWLLA